MSLRYTHTLIPTSPTFTPAPAQVEEFLAAMLSRGALGGQPTLTLLTPSTKTRQVRSPFRGETQLHPVMDHQPIVDVSGVAEAIAPFRDYRVGVAAAGLSANPPLPVDFDEPYHLGITCILSSILRSTSDPHDLPDVPFYGHPVIDTEDVGYFTNPYTMDVIEVPNAGCAKFWIEFDLGNSVFPPFDTGAVDFLDPEIVRSARAIFQTEFAQGCVWG
jgi:hypothetical protein